MCLIPLIWLLKLTRQLTCTFTTQQEPLHIHPLAWNVILKMWTLNKKKIFVLLQLLCFILDRTITGRGVVFLQCFACSLSQNNRRSSPEFTLGLQPWANFWAICQHSVRQVKTYSFWVSSDRVKIWKRLLLLYPHLRKFQCCWWFFTCSGSWNCS